MARDTAAAAGGKAAKGADAASPMENWVARARGVGAIVGFLIAFQVCRGQGFATSDAILRGLGAAVAMSLVAWWSALIAIQALMRSAVVQAQREADTAAAEAAAARATSDSSYGRRPPSFPDEVS